MPDKNTRPSVRGLVDLIRGSDGLPLVAWEPQEGEEFFARLFQAVGDRAAAQPPLRMNALRLASTVFGGLVADHVGVGGADLVVKLLRRVNRQVAALVHRNQALRIALVRGDLNNPAVEGGEAQRPNIDRDLRSCIDRKFGVGDQLVEDSLEPVQIAGQSCAGIERKSLFDGDFRKTLVKQRCVGVDNDF